MIIVWPTCISGGFGIGHILRTGGDSDNAFCRCAMAEKNESVNIYFFRHYLTVETEGLSPFTETTVLYSIRCHFIIDLLNL